MRKKYSSPHHEAENKVSSNLDVLLPLITERLAAGQSVKFSPRGISMLPMIRQGRDKVVISRPPERLKKYDIPLYRRTDGSFVLHRIIKAGATYTCIGDNQLDAEGGIAHDQVIGVVTAFTRGDKEYSVSCFGYRVYCRMWHFTRPLRRLWRSLKYRARRLKRRLCSLMRKHK